MQVVITIEGSQADVFEQEPDELVQFSTDGEYTCVDGCGVLTYPESELTGMSGTLTTITFTPSGAVLKRTGTAPHWASTAGCWICCMSWILTTPAPTAAS